MRKPSESGPPANARWILATTILASSLAFVDGSVVNVGLPAIGRSLSQTGEPLAWVLNGYLLPLSALLLIGGAAGDRYGRRRMLMLGTGLFAAASLLCALAPGMAWLIAGRLLQGVGAALLMPSSLAILGTTFTGAARGRAVGIWAAAGAAAGAVGPLIGGWLIDTVGWRAIFAINLPIALAAVVLAQRHVPDETGPARPPLDLAGGLLATLALAALTWALTAWSAQRQADAAILAALCTGLVAALAFLLVQRRLGERAMLPLALFGSRDFVGLTWLTLLLYGALGGVMVLIPYVLIESQGYSATAAGAALLPLPVVLALASSAMGRLAGRVGAAAADHRAGGHGRGLRSGRADQRHGGVGGTGSYWTTVFPALMLVSLGMAIAVAPLTTAVLESVPAERNGVASGFNSAIARTGSLVASALLGGVLAAPPDQLAARFHIAVLATAAAALAAGVCAFLWVGERGQPRV